MDICCIPVVKWFCNKLFSSNILLPPFCKLGDIMKTFPPVGSECLLTPEESIGIQNAIGGDIMMQLDDVVDVREKDYERFKTATHRFGLTLVMYRIV